MSIMANITFEMFYCKNKFKAQGEVFIGPFSLFPSQKSCKLPLGSQDASNNLISFHAISSISHQFLNFWDFPSVSTFVMAVS